MEQPSKERASTASVEQPSKEQASTASVEQPSKEQEQKTFTLEELAKYDGKNGNPAYVAVDGKVYDVTNVPEWKGGIHNRRFEAGRDLTNELKRSPHGKAKLDDVPVVGTLAP